MSPAWHIARRDLIAAFTTPLAWLVIACWTLLTNFIFVILRLYPLVGTAGADEPLYLSTLTAGIYFLTLLSPALTMNSFAAERNQGTMQLLLTVPVRETHLVLGKWLASFTLLATLAATILIQVAVLYVVSEVAWPQLAAGFLGLLLASALFAALGVWISLLVDSPVAAYVLSFGAISVLMLLGLANDDSVFGLVGRVLGLPQRCQTFFNGEVRLADLLWFLAGTTAFLTLAHASLTARRIHG